MKRECDGDEVYKGYQPSAEICGQLCEDVSSLFIFATKDFDSDSDIKRCNDEYKCNCWCETSAKDGKCEIIENKGMRLYKYVNGKWKTIEASS